jgi:hypothetical protein
MSQTYSYNSELIIHRTDRILVLFCKSSVAPDLLAAARLTPRGLASPNAQALQAAC